MMLELFKQSFEEIIHDHFENVNDVKYSIIKDPNKEKGPYHFLLLYHETLCKWGNNESDLLTKLESAFVNHNYNLLDTNIEGIREIKIKNLNQIDKSIFNGDLLVYSSLTNRLFAIPFRKNNIINHQDIDEFTINSNNNIGLIRERIKSSKLKNLRYTIGEYTKTNINLLYIEDLCDNEVIEELDERLNNAHFDSIHSLAQLHNIVLGNRRSLIPLLNQSSKVSHCVDSLLSGQFVVVGNSFPSCLIGPVNFSSFITSSKNEHYLAGLLERFVKIIALILGVFTLGLAASLYSFNPELLPYILISNVINARKGIFINVQLELIIAEFIFQIIRILSNRKLSAINSAFVIVSGILVGQFAVSSGLIGQDILIITAVSFISIYLVSNNLGFNSSLYFFRIVIFIASMLFGLVGFTISSILFAIFLVKQESFNIPFMSPIAPLNLKKLYRTLLPKSYFAKQNKLHNELKEVE